MESLKRNKTATTTRSVVSRPKHLASKDMIPLLTILNSTLRSSAICRSNKKQTKRENIASLL